MKPDAVLKHLRERSVIRWLGIMSGTCCDGVDLVRVNVEEQRQGLPKVSVDAAVTVSWSDDVAQELIAATAGDLSVIDATRWDRRLGDFFAETAGRFQSQCEVDAVALSGHTFAHLPEEGATLQLGSPALVAEQTGLPVIAGFRAADVARGGEGAPLVPAGDRILFAEPDVNTAVINIGGISNVTWLPGTGTPVACDCGPGNMILNHIVREETQQPFDRDGIIALAGEARRELVEGWLSHPFFASSVRSTGREEFGEAWVRDQRLTLDTMPLADRLATVCVWIAESIGRSIDALRGVSKIDRVLLGGGGAYNRAILNALEGTLGQQLEVLSHDRHGVDADFREAAAFAILGHEYLHGRPGSFPETTGCRYPGPLGALSVAPCLRG